MRFLDTNIFLRHLVKPQSPTDQQKQSACFELFQRIRNGTERVTTCEAVVTEVIYNLVSPRQYNLTHQEAGARLRPLLALPGLRLPQKRVYLTALELFAQSPFLDFEDAVIVAHMQRQGLAELLSYDADFDRIPTVQRREP
jgi:predicted nucleic acid-binding protein